MWAFFMLWSKSIQSNMHISYLKYRETGVQQGAGKSNQAAEVASVSSSDERGPGLL